MQLQRTLASLRRLYEEKGEIHISSNSSSSFYDRFTPELVKSFIPMSYMVWKTLRKSPNQKPNDKLSGFKYIVAQDNTIIRLHERLADKWLLQEQEKQQQVLKQVFLLVQ
ncbi:MAG: hypothetical protein EF812_04970 [Methanosarcinales archaeon]|nr:MAG: hypothetical protein EF812_04970 [Methanosarcinales archaeon]